MTAYVTSVDAVFPSAVKKKSSPFHLFSIQNNLWRKIKYGSFAVINFYTFTDFIKTGP